MLRYFFILGQKYLINKNLKTYKNEANSEF